MHEHVSHHWLEVGLRATVLTIEQIKAIDKIEAG